MKQTIEINDPLLLRKVTQLAKKKRIPLDACLQELFTQSVRVALGIEADLSRSEAASRLGCHVNTVQNYLGKGLFPNHYFRGTKTLRIPVTDVEALKRNRASHN